MDYHAFIDSELAGRRTLTPRQRRQLLKMLVFSAWSRCPCGAGLAYLPGSGKRWPRSWDCSAFMLGDAIPAGEPGAMMHDSYPFAFWEIKSERYRGVSTRPPA